MTHALPMTARQIRFAELTAAGHNGVDAYRQAYEITPRTRAKRRQLAARACALRAKPAIAALIAELREGTTSCSPTLSLDGEASGTPAPAPLSQSTAAPHGQPADEGRHQPADDARPAAALLDALERMTGAALRGLDAGELQRLEGALRHWHELAALDLERRKARVEVEAHDHVGARSTKVESGTRQNPASRSVLNLSHRRSLFVSPTVPSQGK